MFEDPIIAGIDEISWLTNRKWFFFQQIFCKNKIGLATTGARTFFFFYYFVVDEKSE